MDIIFPIFQKKQIYNENKIIANLSLQMALYFNVLLFPIWFIHTIIMLNIKFNCFSAIYQVVVITTTIIIVSLECVRLYLGYSGNLEDKIPDLAGFWMLSFLIQFPMQCFLTFNPNFEQFITEVVLQCIMLILLLTQLITGYLALRTAAKHQVMQFQLQQFTSIKRFTIVDKD